MNRTCVTSIEEDYKKYANLVYNTARARIRNQDVASDILSNVFMKHIRYMKMFESEEHKKHWLLRVTINECNRYYNSWWRKCVFTNKSNQQIENSCAYEFTVKENNVLDCINKLPRELRDITFFHYYHGYTSEQLSEIFNINASTIRNKLQKSRKLLKEMLSMEYNS